RPTPVLHVTGVLVDSALRQVAVTFVASEPLPSQLGSDQHEVGLDPLPSSGWEDRLAHDDAASLSSSFRWWISSTALERRRAQTVASSLRFVRWVLLIRVA